MDLCWMNAGIALFSSHSCCKKASLEHVGALVCYVWDGSKGKLVIPSLLEKKKKTKKREILPYNELL